jgi:hypothetical protein
VKTFKQIREKKSPKYKGDVVYSAKSTGSVKVPVAIVKEPKGFCVYIDGDKLDVFKTQALAMKTLKTTLKSLGGKLK